MRTVLKLSLGFLVAISPCVSGAAQTSLGNGVAGASTTVCPGTSGRKLDGFSLVTDVGSDAVTGLTVTTTGYFAIQTATIWNEAGTTQYFATITAPGSNILSFGGGTPIPVSAASGNYKVVVTYRSEAQSPPPGSTPTTAYVSSITTVNPVAGNDTADSTVTLNNVIPAPGASWGSTIAGDGQVTVNWTLGTTGNRVLIVRYTANVDTTFPVDGTTYAAGDSFGAGGTVRYVGGVTSFTDTGLTNGTTYYYRIFELDGCNNYVASAPAAPWSTPLTPTTAPTATTGAASVVTLTTAQVNGAANPGGASTTGWFRYATSNPGACNDTFGIRAPVTGGSSLGSGVGSVAFSRGITGLTAGTTYYVCAVAQNAAGMAFGPVVSFTTPQLPGVTTLAATPVTASGATLNATVNPNGSAATGWFRYAVTAPGACDDTFGTRAPAAGGTPLGSGAVPVALLQPLIGLAPATTYWFCAVASNASGTAFGAVASLTTSAVPPTVAGPAATLVTGTTARLDAAANPGGASTSGWFRYSTTNPGACDDAFGTRAPASGGASLGAGASPVDFSQQLTGLTPATTYHACAIASSAEGTAFGGVVSFSTPAQPPAAITQGATQISSTGAHLQGSATPNGDATTAWFRLASSHPGACSDTLGTRLPAAGGIPVGSGGAPFAFGQAVTGLAPGTTSFFCAIAQNGVGLGLGEVQSFTTWDGPTVTTRDATALGPDGATLQGTAVPHLSDTTGWFRHGPVDPVNCDDAFGTRVPVAGVTALGAGAGPVDFSGPITGLLPGRTYYACAIAASDVGTRFGQVVAFTTATAAPAVATMAPTGVEAGAAVLHGSADPNGDPATGWFRYDTVQPAACDDAFGVRVPATAGEPLGGGTGAVAWASAISGLSPATNYYACALASNALGTGIGEVVTFRTGAIAPAVATLAATDLTGNGATLEGTAVPNGSDSTGWFRLGDADPGTCDDTFGERVPATGGVALGAGFTTAAFSLAQGGLEPARTYFYCAAATNLGGAAFGPPVAFTTAAVAPAVRSVASQAGEPGAVTLRGAANPSGTAAQGWFRYATTAPASCTDAFGVRVPASGGIDLGAGRSETSFSQPLSGLAPGTYWFCAIASGAGGTAFGALLSAEAAAPPAAPTGGCGCGPGAAAEVGPLWLAVLMLLWRRRRRAAPGSGPAR